MANFNTAASVQSPADVVNLALAVLGYKLRVGSLLEGSAAAKKALDVYAETRDEVLRSKDWPFALRSVTASAGPSTVPGWAHSWVYPTDCLRVRYIAPGTIPSPDYDPQPVLWTLYNDQTQTPPALVILSQITPVAIFYLGRITDMTAWEPLFVNAVVQALAVKLAPSLKDMAPLIDPLGAVSLAATADDKLSPDDAAAMSSEMPEPKRGRAA